MRAPALANMEERLTRKAGLSPPAESVRFTLMLSKLFGVIQQQGLEAHFSLRAITPIDRGRCRAPGGLSCPL